MNSNIGYIKSRGAIEEEESNSDTGETGNTNFNRDIY